MRRSWVWCAVWGFSLLVVDLPRGAGLLRPLASASASEGVIVWRPGYSFIWAQDVPLFTPFVVGYPYVSEPGFGILAPAPLPIFPVPIVNLPPVNAAAPPAVAPAPADPEPAKSKLRSTNSEWKARAGKFISYGDAQFGKQQYSAAVERYKSAVKTAPDLAESYFRQGFALIAMGHYDSAVKAFRRGLRIRADWSDSPFRLDQIYGNDKLAKTSHLESLAKAVEQSPFDATPLVALGMQIYFNGEPERSEVFFVRAAQLGGNDDRLLDSFLPRPGPAGAPRPPGAIQPGGKLVF